MAHVNIHFCVLGLHLLILKYRRCEVLIAEEQINNQLANVLCERLKQKCEEIEQSVAF